MWNRTKKILKSMGLKHPRHYRTFYQAPRLGLSKKALLHYKTESLFDKRLAARYRHTNAWEAIELVRLLNTFGYEVDVLDRTNRTFLPKNDDYDLLISNASGNSGAYFCKLAESLPNSKKVFYALGPSPDIANKLVLDRYIRHPQIKDVMRVMDQVDIEKCMRVSDYIVCLDDNGFSSSTYQRINKPLHIIKPSISQKCYFNSHFINTRNRKTFLCFTGDGFITKGVDYLVESFMDLPDYKLYIAGPNSDMAFNEKYGRFISQSANIKYVGFLTIGSPEHLALMKECAFVILPSSAEGMATSIATCMKYGLIPLVTYECGVDVSTCGYYFDSNLDRLGKSITETVVESSELTDKEYRDRVYATVKKATDYSQASFTHTWTKALSSIISDNK